jgi:hypothetical protein
MWNMPTSARRATSHTRSVESNCDAVASKPPRDIATFVAPETCADWSIWRARSAFGAAGGPGHTGGGGAAGAALAIEPDDIAADDPGVGCIARGGGSPPQEMGVIEISASNARFASSMRQR